MARIARGEEVVDSAMQVIANAVTVEQLRQAQAVVLPLQFAMSLEQMTLKKHWDAPCCCLLFTLRCTAITVEK